MCTFSYVHLFCALNGGGGWCGRVSDGEAERKWNIGQRMPSLQSAALCVVGGKGSRVRNDATVAPNRLPTCFQSTMHVACR